MTDEGSVFVDGIDSEDNSEDESTTENVNNQVDEGSETKKDSTETGSGETTSETKDQTSEKKSETENTEQDKTTKVDGEAEKTEKGTKLATDPLSQANQLRANAEADAREYARLLNDPERLEVYLQELKKEKGGGTEKETDQTDLSKLDPDKLETVEDLRKFAKSLKEATANEIASMKKQVTGLSTSAQEENLNKRISGGISAVQTKYPELREFNPDGSKNPEYNEELDSLIGATYNDLDKDAKTGKYRGAVDIVKIADRIMGARRIGEGAGSRKAKTDILDKGRGRITGTKTGTDGAQPDDTKLSPSATIAERMKRAAAARRR